MIVPQDGNQLKITNWKTFADGYIFSDSCLASKERLSKSALSLLANAEEVAANHVEATSRMTNQKVEKGSRNGIGQRLSNQQLSSQRNNSGVLVHVNDNVRTGVSHLMNFKSKDKSNMVLHHQVLVSNSYEDIQMVRVSKIDEGIINFIISTEEFSGQFANFMKNYEELCLTLSADHECTLLVVISKQMEGLHLSPENDVRVTLNRYMDTYKEHTLKMIEVAGSTFSYARVIHMSTSLFEDTDLLLFGHDNFRFDTNFLHRCKLNTILTKQVFFPVPFQKYGEEIEYNSSSDINDYTGYWAKLVYDAFCIYNMDMLSVANLPSSAHGVFKEFTDSQEYQVMRTLDDSLVLLWQHQICKLGGSRDWAACSEEYKLMNMN